MKFLAYSAGGGMIAAAFLLLIMQGNAEPTVTSAKVVPPVSVNVRVVKIPLVILPIEIKDEKK